MRLARSSGNANFVPFDRKISVTVRPVARRTLGTPCASRSRIPIAAEVWPSWCRRTIVSSISDFSIVTHSGLAVWCGRVEPLFPLRCAWRRAIISSGEAAHTAGAYLTLSPRPHEHHDSEGFTRRSTEVFPTRRHRELGEAVEAGPSDEPSDFRTRIRTDDMALVESIENPTVLKNEKPEVHHQPRAFRIELRIGKTENLPVFSLPMDPRLNSRPDPRGMPIFEHKEPVRCEMAAYGTKASQDVSIREDVTERSEHRDRHIERAAQVERAHATLN